jgi:hypothetical protein
MQEKQELNDARLNVALGKKGILFIYFSRIK